MALPLPNTTAVQITRLTKALYDAAPGYTYMTAFTASAGTTTAEMSTFANWLAGTVSSDAATLASTVVTNLGLTGDAATAGTAYLTAQFESNAGNYGRVILDAMNALSTMESDATYGAAASDFNNSVATAYSYSIDADNTSTNLSTLQSADEPVATGVGTTYTLTTATDNIAGTTGDDTIIGDWGTTTVNSSDQINASTGTDTLKLYGTLGSLPATVTGVEVLNLVNPGTAAINLTTLGAPTSLTKLMIDQMTATTVTTTGHSGLTLDLATAGGAGTGTAVTWAANATDTTATLELSGYSGATGATATAFDITGAATTTLNINTDTAASAITTLTGPATATTVNIAAATNLTLSTSLVAAAAKTVNVSGAGKVTIAGSDLAATVTVDGSTNTGGVLYTAEAGGSTLTFKGGSGDDKATFAAGTLTTADVLTGGTGTDTIAINDTALTTAGGLAHVNAQTGFETLGLNTTGASLDMSLLTNGITNVAIGAGNISATTSNSLATSSYTIDNSASNTGTVSIGNKVGELATAVTLDYGTATAAKTLAALTLNGATTVSLVSTGTGSGGSNIITTLTNMDNSVINVTGAKNLTITNALAGTGTGSKVDATNFTGILTVTGSGQADILIGGSKADVIDGGAGKDTITGGAGADVITVSTATSNDVLTGGADGDSFKFSGTATTMFATSNGTSDIVRITDFVAGTDKIGLVDTAGAFTSVTLATQTLATAADLTAVWAGITAIAASTDNGAAAATLLTVSAGAAAGTYLYVNDTNAAVSNALDLLVNVTGISGTLATTDFVFA
ncbi:MAG: hypothetical protein OEV89_00450 [Desulfobulbaceae bacterium]|nr:hypothetical protein [Desulfobulbaceae bacterium]HIJ89313.1 calcium-binding protein [Deltaproteobacteria bacterium]